MNYDARREYVTLNGLRGVAAVTVMLYHYSGLFVGDTLLLPSAYLAVDLFFILSGFVIAHAYDQRLHGGMTFKHFAWLRLVRLYPLYALTSLVGVSYFFLKIFLVPEDPIGISFANLLSGSLFLPTFSEGHENLYPFNPAAWSLFFELIANFVYALLIKRMSNRVLGAIVVFGAVGIILSAFHFGSLDVGMTQKSLAGGAARVMFSFSLGVLLWRLRDQISRISSAYSVLLLFVSLILLALPMATVARPFYDLFCVAIAFPVLVRMGSSLEAGAFLKPAYTMSADLSYPIYLVHGPMFLFASAIYKQVFDANLATGRPLLGLATTAATLVASYLVVRYFDEPVRSWLRRRPASRTPVRP